MKLPSVTHHSPPAMWPSSPQAIPGEVGDPYNRLWLGMGARVELGRPVWMRSGFISIRQDIIVAWTQVMGVEGKEVVGFWIVFESRANVIC